MIIRCAEVDKTLTRKSRENTVRESFKEISTLERVFHFFGIC